MPGEAENHYGKPVLGSAAILSLLLGKMAYRLLLERTPAMMELRRSVLVLHAVQRQTRLASCTLVPRATATPGSKILRSRDR